VPNTNPQAILIANSKIRPDADRFGQLYGLLKIHQAEANAEGWMSLFPNDSEVIVDGSAVDGRTPITNADVRAFIIFAAAYITLMEQNSSANLNLTMKIAVNPEQF
jgi:hypothetical protein